MSLAFFNRELLPETGWWARMTSYDLDDLYEVTDQNLDLDHQ